MSRYRPYQPRSVFVDPINTEFQTESGLIVDPSLMLAKPVTVLDEDAPPPDAETELSLTLKSYAIPFVLGRVTAVGESVWETDPGDVVWFPPYAYDREPTYAGDLYVMHVDNILAVIEDYPTTTEEENLVLEPAYGVD